MTAEKYFSSQFQDIRQEKLRRRRRYMRRLEARAQFRKRHQE